VSNIKRNALFYFSGCLSPLHNTSSTLENLLNSYDIRLRPNFGGKE